MIRYTWIFALFFLLLFSCKQENPNALFTALSPNKTGVKFKNLVRESEEFNVLTYGYFYQGGGVAVGDINNDGLPDLFFTGNMVASKLYLNKGNFEFEDITEKAGVAAAGLWNTGVTMADVNGDGLLDIYICRSAANDPNNRRNLLFINNGDLTFTESAKEYGIDDPGYSTQASFFDYDNDGDLDLFLLNHSTQEYAGFSRIDGNFKNRTGDYLGDKLYRNDGGKFTDVTQESGIINNVLGFGLGLTVTDVNNDGWLDIYISNDYNEEDYLYINQQDGTFKESLKECMGHVSLFSMGADGADLNNDLLPDIITMDMMPEYSFNQKSILGPENYQKYQELLSKGFYPQTMRNMLQLNQGNGYFSEIGQLAGISNTDWSWAVLAADYDNDGWKDLLITNGYARNYLDMDFLNYMVSEKIQSNQVERQAALIDLIEKMPPIYVQNYLYKNNGDLTFTNMATPWGITGSSVSNAAAYADLDGDGDLDLIICHTNEVVSIYKNNSERLNDNNFLKVKLKGDNANTFGIGARVLVYGEDRHFHQEMIPVRGYQSSVDYELLFGLGEINKIDSLVVFWPDGRKQALLNVEINEQLLLSQKDAGTVERAVKNIVSKFTEVNDFLGLDYKHEENYFLDFIHNRLMPNTLSTLGPKITKGDFSGDGREDVYLGGGKDSPGRLYQQLPNGTFKEIPQEAFETDKMHIDTDAVFVDINGDGRPDLYVVSGGSEFPSGSEVYQDRVYINQGNGKFVRDKNAIPDMRISGSTVAAGDFDGDGNVDLFVGSRFEPGSYPLSGRSYLLKNKGDGTLKDVTEEVSPELVKPGMVTDALFVHLDNDRWIDLVVVGEWMEIGVYQNKEGKQLKRNANAISEATEGWWLKIAAHDVDQDGDMDLVIGNFGRNNVYHPSKDQPLNLIYKDFDDNGFIDPIFTYYIADTNAFAFSRDELIGQIPGMKAKFPDYKSFAKADVSKFFTKEQLSGADSLNAYMLESIYLENDGNGNFKLSKLPVQAQFSPLFAIDFVDVDLDGNIDIIAGGNLTRSRVSSGPADANYGLAFLGNGAGSFTFDNPQNSGFMVRGDVRDIQIIQIGGSDYVLFSRNDDTLKVYKME